MQRTSSKINEVTSESPEEAEYKKAELSPSEKISFQTDQGEETSAIDYVVVTNSADDHVAIVYNVIEAKKREIRRQIKKLLDK